MVFLLALAAAALFALGSVVQQRVASAAPASESLRPSLLLHLVRRPLWLAGIGAAAVGNVLSGAALGIGGATLVSPLLTTRVVFALPIAAAWARTRVPARDWGGAVAAGLGLAAFLAIGRPGSGDTSTASPYAWALTVVVLVALVLVARKWAIALPGSWGASLLGATAGAIFGVQAALVQTSVDLVTSGGAVALLTGWTTYAIPLTALTGTLLAQSAYEMAPLTASYPAMVAVEPLIAVLVGTTVLGGTLQLGALPVIGEVLGALVLLAGVMVLATSPLVTGQRRVVQTRHDELVAEQLVRTWAGDVARVGRRLQSLTPQGNAEYEVRRVRLEQAVVHDRLQLVRQRLDDVTAGLDGADPHERDELLRARESLSAGLRDLQDQVDRVTARADAVLARAGVSPSGDLDAA